MEEDKKFTVLDIQKAISLLKKYEGPSSKVEFKVMENPMIQKGTALIMVHPEDFDIPKPSKEETHDNERT